MVKSLRQPEMVVHHVLMAGLSYLALEPMFNYFCVFFFGVIELSSIPLVIVDVFHPRHKAWVEFAERRPHIEQFAFACRALFAFLYLIVRASYFPMVILTGLFVDLKALLGMDAPPIARSSLYIVYFASGALTLLQLYWAQLVVKQVAKVLGFGGKAKRT